MLLVCNICKLCGNHQHDKKKEQPQTIIDTHTIDLSAICMAAVSL